MDDSLFQLRFCGKQLEKLSKKSEKEQKVQERKVKQYLQKGDVETARIYAENAIRKKNEGLTYLRMAGKVDAVHSRVKSAHAMKGVARNMGTVVKTLDKAINTKELQKITAVMEKFETQFEGIDVHTSVMNDAMSTATTTSTPVNQVDNLIKQVAEEAGLEVSAQLASVPATSVETEASMVQDDSLSRRLADLRN